MAGAMIVDWLSAVLLLAQKEGAKAPAQQPGPGQGMGLLVYMVPVIVIMLLFQFMFNPRRKDEKRRAELLSRLKKNDRIVTIGGITGTVASVSEDQRYVTIKVEDNTRIKMLASSIQSVVGDDTDETTDGAKAN